MSVVEEIEKLGAVPALSQDGEESDQLKDLEEVEATLREIGVSLEPRFDISLAARIGGGSAPIP
jgi:hypothetical protein